MQLDFFSDNLSNSPALSQYAQGKVAHTLRGFSNRVQRVVVRLIDINGRRGGADKLCRVHVSLPGMKPVFAKAIHRDAYAAVDRAISALRGTIARHFGRVRNPWPRRAFKF